MFTMRVIIVIPKTHNNVRSTHKVQVIVNLKYLLSYWYWSKIQLNGTPLTGSTFEMFEREDVTKPGKMSESQSIPEWMR